VPRPPRIQVAGGIYHLGLRGVRRTHIFRSEGDYDLFESLLGTVVERFDWRCHTYCLMPNHYHLLVETPQPNLSDGMQRLNSTYAQWFNQLHGFSGHVFERRFFSRLVESTYDLLELVRYIVLNPVRAGICAEARAWNRSGYHALAGESSPAAFFTADLVLGHFGVELDRAHEAFRDFIRDAPPHYRSHGAAGKSHVRGLTPDMAVADRASA
jgi:REP element-mobilizing transposase RayT